MEEATTVMLLKNAVPRVLGWRAIVEKAEDEERRRHAPEDRRRRRFVAGRAKRMKCGRRVARLGMPENGRMAARGHGDIIATWQAAAPSIL